MSEMIISEARFYLSSFLWGMALTALYDVLRICRRILPHRKIGIAIEDILFWIAAAGLVFRMVYQYNDGILRFPGMIVLALGMVLYHYLVSNPFVGFLTRRIIQPSKKLFQSVHRVLKNTGKKFTLVLHRKKPKDSEE